MKTIDLEFMVKNNPFVKKSPTLRTLRIIERTEQKILMRVTSKSRDVPYCDSFYVEEEWYVASLPEGCNSCVLKVSYNIVFVKSTLMRSVISSTAASEAKSYWVGWNAMIKEKGLEFKQIEKPRALSEEKKSQLPTD